MIKIHVSKEDKEALHDHPLFATVLEYGSLKPELDEIGSIVFDRDHPKNSIRVFVKGEGEPIVQLN